MEGWKRLYYSNVDTVYTDVQRNIKRILEHGTEKWPLNLFILKVRQPEIQHTIENRREINPPL